MGRDMRCAVYLALSLLLLGCEPMGVVPGGRLSGTVAVSAPTDWSFAAEHGTVQLETRPPDPYSVNLWGVGIGAHFYLASGRGGDGRWAKHIADDPHVRLRVGDTIYELRAVRVVDAAEAERFMQAVMRKYDLEPPSEDAEQPEGLEESWVYRLEPR